MATRADDLEPAVAPVAKKLALEYGNLKRVLSAGVLVFDWLPSDFQKAFMARAGGQEMEVPPLGEIAVRRYLEQALVLARKLPEGNEPDRRAKRTKFR